MREWKSNEYAHGFEDGLDYAQSSYKRNLSLAFMLGIIAAFIPATITIIVTLAVG